MQARDGVTHRDALGLSGLDSRKATLDLGRPCFFCIWIDARAQALDELLRQLPAILFGQGQCLVEYFVGCLAHR